MKSTNGRDVLMCSFHGGLPLWLCLPLPVDPPSPHHHHLSLGRLSNREEMLGISRCRAKDQMCGLEVVRQTKYYKAAYRDTSEDGGQWRRQQRLMGVGLDSAHLFPEEQDALRAGSFSHLRKKNPTTKLYRPQQYTVW